MAMSKKSAKSVEELLKVALVPKEEQPYEVPDNWIYFYFTSLLDVSGGTQPPKSEFINEPQDGYIRLIQIRDFATDKYATYIPNKKNLRLINEDDIVIARYGASLGKILTGLSGAINVALAKLSFSDEIFDRKFLYYLLQTQHFQGPLMKLSRSAQNGFNKNDLSYFPMPLPPLNEQKRIADKVERLLVKINQAKQLIEEAKETFELRRAAILDKAFRGELTKKWREENQVEMLECDELYQLIKKERLENAESNRELKEVSQMFEEFNLRESIDSNGWIHLKANMFCVNINCGRTPSKDISDSGDIPFLKVYNIVNNKIDFDYKPQFIPKEVSDSNLGKSKLIPNDVIMNIVGPPLKKIAIIPSDYPEWNMNQAIVRFRPLKYVLPKYLYYCLQYDETLKEVINETRGVVGQSNISVSQSRNLSMPIPSIDEQNEIVNALEQLLIKESLALDILTAKNDELERLKQSILTKAFTGSLGTGVIEDEPAINLLFQSI